MKSPRNYHLLLAGQFLGAFGDNFLLAGILAPLTFLKNAGTITVQDVNSTNTQFNMVFFVPFILLAPLAGFLNDRMPKTSWLLGGNLIKLLGALIGFAGILLHSASHDSAMIWQIVGYAIVGIGACVYSPAKYGVLPEVVETEKLVKANGTVEMLTLVGSIGGFALGGVLYDQTRALTTCYVAAIIVYALAALANGMMQKTPGNPSAQLGRSLQEFFGHAKSLLTHQRIGRILLGSMLFWLAAAFLRTNLQAWGMAVFAASGIPPEAITNTKLALFKASPIIAIAVGSVLAGRIHALGDLSKQWLYAMGLAAGVALMGALSGNQGLPVVMLALTLAGVMAGMLIVPLNASLQHETSEAALGKTIAVQNVIDNAGMIVGAGLLGVMTKLNFSPHQAFLGLAGVVVILTLGMKLSTKNIPPTRA